MKCLALQREAEAEYEAAASGDASKALKISRDGGISDLLYQQSKILQESVGKLVICWRYYQ